VISGSACRITLLALCPFLVSCRSSHVTSHADAKDPESVKQGSKSASAALNDIPNRSTTVFPEERFDFGEVLSGAIVEHDFALSNHGAAPTVIEKVSMTPPLLVTKMPHAIAPGAEGRIHFNLDTTDLDGKFEGTILVFLNEPAQPEVHLAFSGHIVPPIELSPRPAFFVAGQRGKGNQADMEIVNHEAEPLRVEEVKHPTDRFTTHLKTVKPGQHYRLTLALKPGGPGGRAADTILIRTSSKRTPVLKVVANTFLYERVHTFPDAVEFGRLRADDAGHAAVTMMIHQEGGTDFEARLSSDIPGLGLKAERGPKGNSYQVEITLVAERIRVGTINGSIFIDTNDREFPRISVPVNGQIVEH